jgi:hypothetical protein
MGPATSAAGCDPAKPFMVEWRRAWTRTTSDPLYPARLPDAHQDHPGGGHLLADNQLRQHSGQHRSTPATATTAALPEGPATVADASPAAAAAADGGLKAAVQAYSDAFLTGDGKTAYGLLSQQCRKRTTLAEFSSMLDTAKQLYGSALPIETFSASISGDPGSPTRTRSKPSTRTTNPGYAKTATGTKTTADSAKPTPDSPSKQPHPSVRDS